MKRGAKIPQVEAILARAEAGTRAESVAQEATSTSRQAASGFEQFGDGEEHGGLYEIWAWQDGELVAIDSVESFLD